MILKRSFYMMIVLALLLSTISSCSKATPQATPTLEQSQVHVPTAEPKVSLDLISFPLWNGITGKEPNGQGRDYWDYIATEFNKLHPNVTVNVEMWDWTTYAESRATRLAANNPPDVAYTCDQDLHIFPDWFMPLDAYIDDEYRADVTADTWALFSEAGKVLGFPAQTGWMGLIINADLFRERGVPIPADPDRAWTWDEFMSAVQKLTFDRDGDGVTDVYGTAVAAINWDMEWYNLHYLFNRGARFMDPTLKTFTLNNQAGVAAMQWLLDLQDKYNAIPIGAAGLSLDNVYQMMFRGQVAMYHGAPWVISWMQSSVANGEIEKATDLMLVQYPHFPGETMVTDIGGCGFSVFKRDDPYRQDMAAKLALFITSSERLRDWKAGANMPSRLSSMKGLYDDDPNMTVLLSMAPYGRIFWSHRVDMWTYADQMNAIIPAVFNHDLTPQEALDKFVNEAQPIFDANQPKP